eukprot:GFUD01113386.1.p1 GENE.GFUD01113386.1~~GFUD01113386.1.p1  ORF type:complete len:514 (-),score=197.75 GFUD01113386.1:200-1705(-)
MSLPEMMGGSVRSQIQEKNEVEILVRLLKSDKLREIIEKVSEDRMYEMDKEVDKKIRGEVKTINEAVGNMRKMYLDIETRRLAMREEELKKARQEGDEGLVVEVGQDVRQKLDWAELQVEQLKLSLGELTQMSSKGRREVDELVQEIRSIWGMVGEFNKGRGSLELEQDLSKMKEQIDKLVDMTALEKVKRELEYVKQQVEQARGQSSSVETVKEVIINMLDEHLSTIHKKNVEQQTKEVKRLESMMNEVMIQVNQTEPKLVNTLTSQAVSMKQSMEEELMQLTKSLLSDWSKSQANNSVSLPQVSAMLESHLSLFSADRTGQVDWASLAVGGSIISTPHTTTHPTPGQVLSLLGIPIWQHSTSPRQILQPHAGSGQCWAFSGQSGQVVLQLGEVVRVTGVTIEHIRPSPDLSSAPSNITVWAHKDNSSLLNLTYSISMSSSSVQTFHIPSSLPISQLRLQVTSNWGRPEYTCLYRVRVHGTQMKEGEDMITVKEQATRDS